MIDIKIRLNEENLRAWLRAARFHQGLDPFIEYQEKKMSKGALLQLIVGEVQSYIDHKTDK